jgi:hypothetical protein
LGLIGHFLIVAFLSVDAQESCHPMLERLGFQPLATIRDWTLGARYSMKAPAGT